MTDIVANGETYVIEDFYGYGLYKLINAGTGDYVPRWLACHLDLIADSQSARDDAESASTNTAADAIATAADRVQTGLDRTASAASAVTAAAASSVAVAAAASADFPFATTGGTASAYTVDFTPDRVVGDGFSMRANFHAACNATPTIAVDGGTAYEIVDGGSFTSGGAFRQLDANDIRTGMNLILTYDSTVGKMVITGNFPMYELSRDLGFNGWGYSNMRGYNGHIIKSSGVQRNGVLSSYYVFANATRLYNIKRKAVAGTIDLVFSKNGSTDINFGASPSTTVGVTTSLTEVAVNHSSLAYIDFAAGDYIKVTRSNASGCSDVMVLLDVQENYA